MEFKKEFFDPDSLPAFRRKPPPPQRTGDRRDGTIYVHEGQDHIILSVNAALATGRPLLIEGPPGSGKSSLAPYVAHKLGWWYYERAVTSRTTAQELLWEFDALQRLSDAQTLGKVRGRKSYVLPGMLWWVFSPESATQVARMARGSASANPGRPGSEPEAVLLLDEIDKADPDVPNDLLVPFGARGFFVRETDQWVEAERGFLLVLTTNGERELPSAFLRRCIRLKLEHHAPEQLVKIARCHFGAGREALYTELAHWLERERKAASRRGVREPSTAEYLDAIRACLELKQSRDEPVHVDAPEWKRLLEAVVLKADPPRKENG